MPASARGGHILTCAPTGAGKGIGAVIPNLLDYPGSAFVLDFKGENYAVTARARRAAGQDVFLIDPFGITSAPSHSMNWLDALDPDDPDVVSLSASLADMLVVSSGKESDPHWDEAAKELLRGLLAYVWPVWTAIGGPWQRSAGSSPVPRTRWPMCSAR